MNSPVPKFFTVESKGVRCDLCPHRCHIAPGGRGRCAVRRLPELPYWGLVTALAEDPVEKKPLYHWRPGTLIVSVGFAGCNLRCPFCQNWHISQIGGPEHFPAGPEPVSGRCFSPEALIAAAEEAFKAALEPVRDPVPQSRAIAYTYSEPLVHPEYLGAAMELARSRHIANVLVTNGCVNTEAAEKILSLTDAVNIDLKSFSEKTYTQVLGGNLAAVLDFIRTAVRLAVHTEITTLLVPGLNDSEAELEDMADFIAGPASKDGISPVWHLSAYHPGWKWDAPATDPVKLAAAADRARKKLPHVYTGNIAGDSITRCTICGAVLVRRRGYRIDAGGLGFRDGLYRCAACGAETPFRW